MSNTFSILVISIIAGIIFFVSFQTLLFNFSKSLEKQRFYENSKIFVDLIEKIAKLPADYFYKEYYFMPVNVSIKNNVIKISSENLEFSYYLSVKVEDNEILNTATYCIMKEKDSIKISDCKNIEYTTDGICTPTECKSNSPDCKGPNSLCIGDGYCNTFIGENCRNSKDCESGDGVCCPEDKNADEKGITKRYNLDKGEECSCDNQCKSGLVCNPTTDDFRKSGGYYKACCPPGTSWDGKDCIVAECTYPCAPGCILPKKWDWRNVNGVNFLNPVRNQGLCGACWAFSAIGTVEAKYNLEKNCPSCNKDLSEQQLVSNDNPCCSNCGSCNGGWPHLAFDYIKSVGVAEESCLSYFSSGYDKRPVDNCPICSGWQSKTFKIREYEFVPPNFDEIKRALICNGPLTVASMNWGHAIVLVGYDDDSPICKSKYGKNGCWIIRNSWGVLNGWWNQIVWHENGYAYIPYEGHDYSDLIYYVYYVDGVIES